MARIEGWALISLVDRHDPGRPSRPARIEARIEGWAFISFADRHNPGRPSRPARIEAQCGVRFFTRTEPPGRGGQIGVGPMAP